MLLNRTINTTDCQFTSLTKIHLKDYTDQYQDPELMTRF